MRYVSDHNYLLGSSQSTPLCFHYHLTNLYCVIREFSSTKVPQYIIIAFTIDSRSHHNPFLTLSSVSKLNDTSICIILMTLYILDAIRHSQIYKLPCSQIRLSMKCFTHLNTTYQFISIYPITGLS